MSFNSEFLNIEYDLALHKSKPLLFYLIIVYGRIFKDICSAIGYFDVIKIANVVGMMS